MWEAFTYRAAQHCVGETPSRNIRILCQRKRWRGRERERGKWLWRERGRQAGWERALSARRQMASHIGGGDARAGGGGDAQAGRGRGFWRWHRPDLHGLLRERAGGVRWRAERGKPLRGGRFRSPIRGGSGLTGVRAASAQIKECDMMHWHLDSLLESKLLGRMSESRFCVFGRTCRLAMHLRRRQACHALAHADKQDPVGTIRDRRCF